eukprot:CAMPEP_0119124362 /NCGR_PEP_ID=MMETSP1310-20130426/4012_1 /TAXON_ID=464262 /ORGANISM="Genus nov. species nov., Strain RCC2339" /LENGTH=710 /DNA_ID=CAMNT_0007114309 /DNA_START=127 /DNA_END=2260 /DNA_ORIENTATION=+
MVGNGEKKFLTLCAVVYTVSPPKYFAIDSTCFDPNTVTGEVNAYQGPSSSKPPLFDGNPDEMDAIVSLLTVGDSIDGYRLEGKLDGLGLKISSDRRTFELFVTHSLEDHEGLIRSHGYRGSFVSRWVVDRITLEVLSGGDLTEDPQDVSMTNFGDETKYQPRFRKLSSVEMTELVHTYDRNTGKGSQIPFLLSGEESAEYGRAWSFHLNYRNLGEAHELGSLGHVNFEAIHIAPVEQTKTIIMITDDNDDTIPGGLVLFYIGEKTDVHDLTSDYNELNKAGLVGGQLTCLSIEGSEEEKTYYPPNTALDFTLRSLDANLEPVALRESAREKGCTMFRRPEGGRWRPSRPNEPWFVTAGSWDPKSGDVDADNDGMIDEVPSDGRVWRLFFQMTGDELNPRIDSIGRVGQAYVVYDGGRQLKDLEFSKDGAYAFISEGPTPDRYDSRLFRFSARASDERRLVCLGSHSQPDDSHYSSIVDVSHILAPGWFILADFSSMLAEEALANDYLAGQVVLFYDGSAYQNVPPEVLKINFYPLTPTYEVGQEISFEMEGFDPNDAWDVSPETLWFYFDYGDDQQIEEIPNVATNGTHIFNRPGRYHVTAIIKDGHGEIGQLSRDIQIFEEGYFSGTPQPTPVPSPPPTPTPFSPSVAPTPAPTPSSTWTDKDNDALFIATGMILVSLGVLLLIITILFVRTAPPSQPDDSYGLNDEEY